MATSRINPADAISDVGGARYMWFTFVTGSIDIEGQCIASVQTNENAAK